MAWRSPSRVPRRGLFFWDWGAAHYACRAAGEGGRGDRLERSSVDRRGSRSGRDGGVWSRRRRRRSWAVHVAR